MKCIYLILCFTTFINIQESLCQGHTHLYTIYFQKNKYNIDSKYDPLLRSLAKSVGSDSCRLVKIYGHADTTGSDNYNYILSKKRAYSVLNYLISSNKIDTAKIYIEWLGESSDSYDHHLQYEHVQRRCVDIWVLFNKRSSVNKK